MKLEETNLAGPSAPAVRAPAPSALRAGEVTRAPGAGGAVGGDRVDLSSLTARLAATLAGESRGRAGRVESLARRVQTQSYVVDARRVSRALVTETLSATSVARGTGAAGGRAPAEA